MTGNKDGEGVTSYQNEDVTCFAFHLEERDVPPSIDLRL